MIHGLYYGDKPLPPATNPKMVGKYNMKCKSGGGGRWDQVLEYRVWVRTDDDLYFKSYANYLDAHEEATKLQTKDDVEYVHVVVLIKQNWQVWWESGKIVFNDEETITEWQPEWLLDARQISLLSQEEVKKLSWIDYHALYI